MTTHFRRVTPAALSVVLALGSALLPAAAAVPADPPQPTGKPAMNVATQTAPHEVDRRPPLDIAAARIEFETATFALG